MDLDELRKALETGEEIEYHLMGVEQHAALLGEPGWYRCCVDTIYPSGNVEIALTDPDLDGFYITVLKKNTSIAFRHIPPTTIGENNANKTSKASRWAY